MPLEHLERCHIFREAHCTASYARRNIPSLNIMIESVLVDSIRKISSIFIPIFIYIVETLRATSLQVSIFIAEAADRISVVLVVVVAVHVGVIVVQVAVVCV